MQTTGGRDARPTSGGAGLVAASVRIEDEAFSCMKYERLAEFAGLADADHARGKMAKLWRQCTLEQRYILPEGDVVRVLGPNGPRALEDAGLGEVLAEGVRIRGTRGRIEWLKRLRTNGKKGGRPRKPKGSPSGLSAEKPGANPPAPAPVPVKEKKRSVAKSAGKQDPAPMPFTVAQLVEAFSRGAGERFAAAPFDPGLAAPLTRVIRDLAAEGVELADVEAAGRVVTSWKQLAGPLTPSWLAKAGNLAGAIGQARAAPKRGRSRDPFAQLDLERGGPS